MRTKRKLDIEINQEVNDIITAVQNDTKSRYLDIQLFNNGVVVDLTDHKVRVYGFKADKKNFWNDCKIEEATTGRILLELTTQMLALADVIHLQIKIYNNEETEILSTQIFKVWGTKDLFNNEAVESSNEYGSVVNLFQDVFEVRMQIKEILDKIGEPGSKGEELQKKTLFEQMEWLIDFSQKNSVGSLGEKIEEIIPKIYAENCYDYTMPSLSELNLNQEKVLFSLSGKGELLHAFIYPQFAGDSTRYDTPLLKFKLIVDDKILINARVIYNYRSANERFGFFSKTNLFFKLAGNTNGLSYYKDKYSSVSYIPYMFQNSSEVQSYEEVSIWPQQLIDFDELEKEVVIPTILAPNLYWPSISGVINETPIKFSKNIKMSITLLDKKGLASSNSIVGKMLYKLN